MANIILCLIPVLLSLAQTEGLLNTTLVGVYAQLRFRQTTSHFHCYSSDGTDTSTLKFGYQPASTGQKNRIRYPYLPPTENLGEGPGSRIWTLFGGSQYITGGYYCQDGDSKVVGLKQPPSEYAMMQPAANTIMVNVGESVTLETSKRTYGFGYPYRWTKDGELTLNEFYNNVNPRIESVTPNDAGIYHVVASGFPDIYSAMIRLIVRRCPAGMYGEQNCNKKCPKCINGGVCHDVTGECICPPGFTGFICEKACGANNFGTDCDKHCAYQRGRPSALRGACRERMFCLPDPFGCVCAAGFRGLNCARKCLKGTFGAGCKQTCHCASGIGCDIYTGECEGGCEQGWTGDSCQIKGKPLIPPTISRFYNERVNEGQPAFFVCSITGEPAPEAEDIILTAPPGVQVMLTSSTIDENIVNRTNTFLVSKAQHDFTYECSASTIAGKTSLSRLGNTYQLPILNSRPRPEPKSAVSAKIMWDAWQPGRDKGDAPVIRYHLEHREVGSDKWKNITVVPVFLEDHNDVIATGMEDHLYKDLIGQNTIVNNEISGLKPFTDYEVRVVSSRSGVGGTGLPGPLASFQTLCAEPLSPPLEMRIAEERTCISKGASPSYNFIISWKAPSRQSLQCNGKSHYKLYWKHSNRIEFQSVDVAPDVHQTTITDIPASATVFLKMSVINNADIEGVMSEIMVIETDAAAPSDVRELLVSSITSETLEVTWKKPEVTNGEISYYEGTRQRLCINQCPCSKGNIERFTDVSPTTFGMSGLLPDASYRISVRAVTAGNKGPVSSIEVVTKPNVPSQAPSGANVLNIKPRSAEVEWEPLSCEDLNGPLLHYNVMVFKVEDGHLVQRLKVVHSTSAVLTGLTPHTSYSVSVSTENTAGTGPNTKEMSFVTSVDLSESVTQLVATTKSSNQILVRWTRPEVTNGPLTFYEVTCKVLCTSWCDCSEDGDYVTSSVEDTEFMLDGLKRNTKYRITVRPTNAAGYGKPRYTEQWTSP